MFVELMFFRFGLQNFTVFIGFVWIFFHLSHLPSTVFLAQADVPRCYLPHIYKLVARTCLCGEDYRYPIYIKHCLTYKKGGILRPYSLRDLIAEILEDVCSDVEVEPPLLPLTGEN